MSVSIRLAHRLTDSQYATVAALVRDAIGRDVTADQYESTMWTIARELYPAAVAGLNAPIVGTHPGYKD